MDNLADKLPDPESQLHYTLLFVDDEESILSSLRRLFNTSDYHIFTATSGVEGLRILESEQIDLIISDMRMPEMDGATFLEEAALCCPDTIRMLLTGYSDLDATIVAINRGNISKYISKPWEDNDIRLTVRHALERKYLETERRRLLELTRKQNQELWDLNAHLEDKVQERTSELGKTVCKLENANEALKKSSFAAIKVFSNLVRMHEGASGMSSAFTSENVRELARQMKMSSEETGHLVFAGLLQDISRAGLVKELPVSSGKSEKDRNQADLARNTVVGLGVLMAMEPLHDASRLIRTQHENYDGSGYPDGLSGMEIPLGARILAVVNDYDDLQQGRQGKPKLTAADARQYIFFRRGKRYDPAVVDAFMKLCG